MISSTAIDVLPRIVESLLFVSDGAVELSRLLEVLEVDRDSLERAIEELATASPHRGLQLQRHGGAVQLVTIPEAAPYVEKLRGVQARGKLSPAAVETLAIVAYRQPIARSGVEAIRGVNSDRALATLQTRALVVEVGRAETVGRPILYGTTFEFLQYFGLPSLAGLPPLEEN